MVDRYRLLQLATIAIGMIAVIQPKMAMAGGTITISEDSNVDVGFRVQTLYYNSKADIDGDDSFETVNRFRVRRGRLRVKGNITKYVSTFVQTDVTSTTGLGLDARVIDAWIRLKPHKWVSLYVGEFLAPSSRQDVTSPAALLCIDRPGIAYRALTWGTRARQGFTLNSYSESDAGLRGQADVRDLGAMLFGSISLTDIFHVNYYLGVFEGVQNAERDQQRYTGRLQVNFFDPEPGYVVSSTYVGKKKTIALGASVDTQKDVDFDDTTGDRIDYLHLSFDYFVEYPIGPGFVTSEGAFTMLDLGDAEVIRSTEKNGLQAQGKGFFAQLGYLIADFQPWAGAEAWESDAEDGTGSYWAAKFGLTYFIKGNNAKISAGYEIFRSDRKLANTNKNSVGTFVTGLYVTY
jgi:hypothetical protein